jgi:hypothetical protein
MESKTHIHQVWFFAFTILLAASSVAITYLILNEPKEQIIPDLLTPLTTDSSHANSTQENDSLVREVKEEMTRMRQRFMIQFADLEKQNQKNMRDISAFKRLQSELRVEQYAETPINSEADLYDSDPDYQQEQDAIAAETKQREYMQFLQQYFSSQAEDISWSV